AATRHFTGRAAAERDRWGEFISEATYHRFQRDGKKAATFWRTCLRRPEAEALDARERLAGTVIGSEFLEDKQPRSHHKTGVIVDWHTIPEASFELAYITLQRRLRIISHDPNVARLDSEVASRWQDFQLFEEHC